MLGLYLLTPTYPTANTVQTFPHFLNPWLTKDKFRKVWAKKFGITLDNPN